MTDRAPANTTDVVALAEDLGAIRRRVLNVVGHELRTPATTLQGLAEQACVATDLDTVTAEIGPALLRNATRLMALLDQMLIATGIETAIPVGQPEPLELGPLLLQRWSAVSGGDAPPVIDGASMRIVAPRAAFVTAIDAILDNAHHYGSAAPSIAVHQLVDETIVSVHSPGPALHDDEVRLAREPFFRGEVAVTSRPGLGLGLSIARAVMEYMGGTLRFAAEEGGNLTTITIPTGTAA